MSSSESVYLDQFAKLVTTVSELVRTDYLLPYKMPHWAWPKEQPLPFGKVGHRLHRWYARRDGDWYLFPSRNLLAFAVIISLLLELFYPGVLFLLSLIPLYSIELSWETIGWRTLIFAFCLIVLLFPWYSALGTYWTWLELETNRLLTRRLRFVIFLIVLAVIGLWVITGSSRYSNLMDYGDRDALAIQQSKAYLCYSVFLFYIPSLTYAALWLSQSVAVIAFGVGSAVHWFVSFHVMRSAERINEFLLRPLPLPQGKSPTFLQLDIRQIDALYDWSICRRDAVQNKLVPITLFLAFLGLLANTYLGEVAVQTMGNLIGETLRFFESPMRGFVSLWYLMAWMIPILLSGMLVFELMNDAFTMDFIAQACLLARHAKISREDEPANQHREAKPTSLLGWAKQWFLNSKRPPRQGEVK